ncbi:MAG: LPS assembly protein LptD [Campylobacterota bacterium]|nr:LPS assembly protein LptD [Campylobacterota bacterium]
MLRLFLLFTLLFAFSDAQPKVEIYATSMDSKNNIVRAYDGVTVVYKDYFLSSDEAIYDKNSGILELLGSVRATYGKNYKLLGKYAKLNISKKERSFKPFFMLEKKSKVWISADEGCAVDKDYAIESGVLSGCNPNDPLWKMQFSSSDYNSDDMWLSLYNTRIYIYDIPVIYTPYFGFSLDTKRRTGLLVPALGMSDEEGFYYEQPIYIAEYDSWDLELKPQIRTNRGYGGYSKFRFVDSATSGGEFTTGYFKEKDSYFIDEDLVNDSHYGFNFQYDNSDFINQWFGLSLEGQSGLYIDVNNMNDVDYINLSTNDTTQNATATQVLSRINLFYNTERNYFAAYYKYYKDLTIESNENTLQQLPTFQYHYYLDTFLKDHLLYSIDLQSNNIDREVNKKVLQTNINIPLKLQTSLFDEYLNLSYTAYLYGQHSSFSGDEETSTGKYQDGIYAREYNIFSLSSELTRAYEEFTHVVDLGVTYVMAGADTRSGYYEYNQDFCSELENQNDPRCDFYNITDVDEVMQIGFSQYLFDSFGKQKLYHKLAQSISYEDIQSRLGELENELEYQITDSINFYNNMFYNYDEHSFSKTVNTISYSNSSLNLSLSHLYKDSFLPPSDIYTPYTSYITSSASYTYDEHYSYFTSLDYDLETNYKKGSEIGFLYKKRCWEFGLRLLENIRPVLTQSGESSVNDRYLYFTILLKPLMSSGSSSNFAARLPDSLQGI